MDGILSPAFMQAACAKGTPEPPVHENVIKLLYTGTTGASQAINIQGQGDVIVEYYKNGVLTKETVTNPSAVFFVTPDNDEFITIKGHVTECVCYGPPMSNVSSNIDVSECETLVDLVVGGPYFSVLKCRADNQTLVNSIISSFEEEVQTTGTLFTNKDDEYYSELEAAVLAKGWTIEEL